MCVLVNHLHFLTWTTGCYCLLSANVSTQQEHMTGFHVEIQRGCSGFFGYSSTPRWRLMKEKDSCHQKEAVIISQCSVFNSTSLSLWIGAGR